MHTLLALAIIIGIIEEGASIDDLPSLAEFIGKIR